MDIVSPAGWWEQPSKGTPEGPWPYHPLKFGRWPRAGGGVGGAEMGVYDVNGDGLNNIVASLEAHGWGLAWYEQKRDPTGGFHSSNTSSPTISLSKTPAMQPSPKPTLSPFADVDGDGIPDFIVGKRLFSHLESYTDPDSLGPPVPYSFRTVRNPRAPAERNSFRS